MTLALYTTGSLQAQCNALMPVDMTMADALLPIFSGPSGIPGWLGYFKSHTHVRPSCVTLTNGRAALAPTTICRSSWCGPVRVAVSLDAKVAFVLCEVVARIGAELAEAGCWGSEPGQEALPFERNTLPDNSRTGTAASPMCASSTASSGTSMAAGSGELLEAAS